MRELLAVHYDPGYERSMAANFACYGQAQATRAADRSPAEMERLALQLIASEQA